MSSFQCKDIHVAITDVFTSLNLIQLRASLSYLHFSSCCEQANSEVCNAQGLSDILLVLPSSTAQFDFDLTSLLITRCKLQGTEGEPASINCKLNFVEKLFDAHCELVRRGWIHLSPQTKNNSQSHRDTLDGEAHTRKVVPCVELTDLCFVTRVSSFDEVYGSSTVAISVEIANLSAEQIETIASISESTLAEPTSLIRVSMQARNFTTSVGPKLEQTLICIASFDIQIDKENLDGRHRIRGELESCAVTINTTVEQNLCGLVSIHDRLKERQRHLLDGQYDGKDGEDNKIAHSQELTELDLRVHRWEAECDVLGGNDKSLRINIKCHGTESKIHSVTEKRSNLSAKHDVSINRIDAVLKLDGNSTIASTQHVATFIDVDISTTKDVEYTPRARDVSLVAKFGQVCVNNYGDRLNTSRKPIHRSSPAALLRKMTIKRNEHVSSDVIDVQMDIQVDEMGLDWSHQLHASFLGQIDELDRAIQSVDGMIALASLQKNRVASIRSEDVPKVTGIKVTSKQSIILLQDVADVAPLIVVSLTDCKIQLRKTLLLATTAFESAFTRLSWDDEATPAVEVVALVFNQRAELGRQRFMVKTPSQNVITIDSLRIFLYPDRRLLALFLHFDTLSGGKEIDKRNEKTRDSTSQSTSIDCTRLVIEVQCPSAVEQNEYLETALSAGEHNETFLIDLNTFGVKLTKTNLNESSDVMKKLLQRISNSATAGTLSALSFSELANKALTFEGLVAAKSLIIAREPSSTPIAVCVGVEVHFGLTDIEWQQTIADSPTNCTLRSLIYDTSVSCSNVLVNADKNELTNVPAMLQTIQTSMDTQGNDNDVRENNQKKNFRFRFFGNIDIGVHRLTIDFPYGDNTSPQYYQSLAGIDGSKAMRLVINELMLCTRQFQKMALQFDTLGVYLVDLPPSGTGEEGNADCVDQVRLVFLPALSANCFIHWSNEWLSANLSDESQEFSVSVDIALRQHPALCAWPSGSVPCMNEALLSLNWEYVYPWLIYMVTDGDDNTLNESAGEDFEASDASSPSICCRGIQWDMSIGTVQVVWWDGMSQEQGVMAIAGELVSHGIALNSVQTSVCLESKDTSTDAADTLFNEREMHWELSEITLYLDRLHGYLLHESPCRPPPNEFSVTSPTNGSLSMAEEEGVIPFERVNNSEFFWESMGTSYRLVISDGMGNEDDDDPLSGLFTDSSVPVSEKIHDTFVPIDYGFSLNAATKLRKLDSLARSGSIQLSAMSPTSTLSGVTAGMPSSPRGGKHWSHTIRSRLSRLKRRTASMDNMLLNDGSCPIQVDSMKLLWTLETRDTVFYMVAILVDSFHLLADAQDQRQQQQQGISRKKKPAASEAGNKPPIVHTRPPSKSAVCSSGTAAIRPPEIVRSMSEKNRDDGSNEQSDGRVNLNRRGSTRDTLLDLLMQGKLGTKATSNADDDEANMASQLPNSAKNTAEDEGYFPAIAIKQYTVDIHDVQINMRDDNSRSSMLVAADRIHLEVGMDGQRTRSEAKLTFDVVTAHVAPIDVDISTRVVWYSNSMSASGGSGSRRLSSAAAPSSSSLLKQVLEECSLSATYTHVHASGASTIDADLSFLQITTDRHQFYQCLNVLRHVLLAPPTTSMRGRSRRTQTAASRASQVDSIPSPTSQQTADGSDAFSAQAAIGSTAPPTKKQYGQLVEELRARELKTLGTAARAASSAVAFKSIAFRASGVCMRLRLSPEIAGADYEFVEIRAEGLTGSHTFYTSQCTKFVLNLQWMEVTNLRPGQSSIAFDDAMSVLRAKLLVDERHPHQAGTSLNSQPLLSSFSASPSRLASNQKGMLSVRAESGPVVRVLGQKLRVLDVLEVSMFPEVSNMIVIQLAADFYELVFKFFFAQTTAPETNGDLTSEQLLFGRKISGTTNAGASSSSSPGPTLTSGNTNPNSNGVLPSPSFRSRLQAPGMLSSPGASRRKSIQPSNSSTASGNGYSTGDSTGGSSAEAVEEDDSGSSDESDGCELFYFKYVRFGNVRLRINCNGFFVNLNNFDLDLPPFVCQSRLYTYQKLLQKFESHLKWYITKESASSGLSQFKNRLLKWTPSTSLSLSSVTNNGGGGSSSDKKDKSKRQDDEDTAALNAQVLFGPYSGTTS